MPPYCAFHKMDAKLLTIFFCCLVGTREVLEGPNSSKRQAKATAEKFVPSPMEEESLPLPKEGHIVQRNEDEISRALTFDMSEAPPLNPQRAQLAFYRPFVADPMEEVVLPAPLRGSVSHHSIAELSQAHMPSYKSIETPKSTNAERMYKRPGFDNVPSY